MLKMRTWIGALGFVVCLMVPLTDLYAENSHPNSRVVQLGGFNGRQGASQDVPISGLIGNQYTLASRHETRPLVGLGYLFNGFQNHRMAFQYGVNALYLFNTRVKGHVIQEHLYETLSYRYQIENVPVYAMGKMNFFPNHDADRWWFTAEAGIGPNFMKLSRYHETSLNGVSLPDDAFLGHANTLLSGMAGVGVRLNHALGNAPLELGYRFMYLGKSTLNRRTDQLERALKTGDVFAQAIVLSFIF